jgi:hypothetical protein
VVRTRADVPQQDELDDANDVFFSMTNNPWLGHARMPTKNRPWPVTAQCHPISFMMIAHNMRHHHWRFENVPDDTAPKLPQAWVARTYANPGTPDVGNVWACCLAGCSSVVSR